MDEIKRKLALIDAEVHRRRLYAQAVETAPLLFPASGLMLGILSQELLSGSKYVPPPAACLWFWAAALALGAMVLAAGHTRWPHRWRSPLLAFGVLICFVCLGAMRLISFHAAGPSDIRHRVGDEQILATVRGWVVTEPHTGEPNWCFSQLAFQDPASRFYLKLDAVKTDRDWTPATGTIHTRVEEPTPNLKPGDQITAECWLHRFPPPSGPGQFDVARYLARSNVHVGAAVPSRDAITVDRSGRPDGWARVRNWMSQRAAQALLGDARIEDPDEGLVQALLLGTRQTIDPETYEAFRRTGLLHLVSLSGMNFAMLIMMIWWFCRLLGLSRNGRAIVGIIATCVFLMTVPPRAPTLRAAIIAFACCAAMLAHRRVRALNSLCLAALIVLWLTPTQLFDAGFQLSFGCMAGILALTRRIEGSFRDLMPSRLVLARRGGGIAMALVRRVVNMTVLSLSAGLAAWVGGAGILLYHFHTITPLTSLWTVLTSILVWLIVMVGFLQMLLAFPLPAVSLLLGDLDQMFARFFMATVRVIAAPRINLLLVGQVGIWVVVLFYGLVLFWLFGAVKQARVKQGICVAVLILIVGHLGVLKWQRMHRDNLQLTCLDVGHGQAILAQLPGTQNVLFDAGSLYKRDIGSRIVVPCLDYMGIGRLDAIIISHGDVDHINGIPEIVARCRVAHVYATEAFFAAAERERAPRLLTDTLRAKGHTIELLPEHLTGGPAAIQKLWPPEPSAATLSDNNLSTVSRIQWNAAAVLLCSDIESSAQRQIMARAGRSQAQIVIAPHHGSTATADEGFLSHFRPRFVVCSCGRKNHPAQQNLPRAAIPEWYHTSSQGTISVRLQGNGAVRIQSYVQPGSTGE